MLRLTDASPLLLASGSPRRREILTSLAIPIVVHAVDVDESVLPGEAADAYLERVVAAKLAAAYERVDVDAALRVAAAILVADTSVVVDGDVLGKPADVDEAEAMIARLAGRTHEVWTRFAIATPDVRPRALREERVVTRVTFRALSPVRIRAYAETREGFDKAGGYAVQGRGAALVARIDGSYTNVVGLPACEVSVALEGLGLVP